jgi:phosphopentomutase
MQRRTFVVAIDACGAGQLPNAWREGDDGANTPPHPLQAGGGPGLPAFASLVLSGVVALRRAQLPGRSFGAHA